MSVDSASNNPFDVEYDASVVSPSSTATSGSGGGDMGAWTAARETALSALIQTTYSNASAYTLPAAVASVGHRPFGLADEEEVAAPSSTSESGSGGGDMGVWSFSDYELVTTVTQTTYTNASSFTIPAGIFTNPNRAFDAKRESGLVKPDNSSGLGYLGPDMGVWTAERAVQLRTLTTATYTNASAYSIPAGFVDSVGYDLGFEDGEEGLALPTRGVVLGANFYNLLIKGSVAAAPFSDLDTENPVKLTDATIVAAREREDGSVQAFSTTPQQDGTFDLSVSEFGEWQVTATREFLFDASTTVNVDATTVSGYDLLLGIPEMGGGGGGGLDLDGGLGMG